MAATREFAPVIHVFTDGQRDYISVVVDAEGLRASAFTHDSKFSRDGLDVVVLDEEHESDETPRRFSILVSRRVSRSATPLAR